MGKDTEIEVEGQEAVEVDDVEKGTSVSAYDVHRDTPSGDAKRTSRTWTQGHKARFPWYSVIMMVLICLLCAGIVVVVRLSDKKDYDTWFNWQYHGIVIRKKGKFYGFEDGIVHASLPVNVIISIFVIICGKCLAFAFVEAFTIYWWLQVMKGKSLRALHYDYEFGRSIGSVIKNPRMFNYLCVCVITYTCFAAVGPILQKSSETKVVSDMDKDPQKMTEHSYFGLKRNQKKGLYTGLPWTFPDGASLDPGNDRALSYLSEATELSYQPFTSSNLPMFLAVDGCPPLNQHRPSQTCGGYFQNIGFHYECEKVELVDLPAKSKNTIFSVEFVNDGTEADPRKIFFTTLYKDSQDCDGKGKLVRRHCTMTPAIVEQFIWFHMLSSDPGSSDMEQLSHFNRSIFGNYALHDSDLKFQNWWKDSIVPATDNRTKIARAELGDDTFQESRTIKYKGGDELELSLDRVVRPIKFKQDGGGHEDDTEYFDLANTTIQGLASVLNNLIGGAFTINTTDKDIYGTRTGYTGHFWPNFSLDGGINDYCQLQFIDPTQSVIDIAREILFRYSVLTAIINPYNEHIYGKKAVIDTWNPTNKTYIQQTQSLGPAGPHNSKPDLFYSVREVYHTSCFLVGVGVFIMLLAILATCSLFWGFWRLGRRVTLSPLETARALQVPFHEEAMPIHPYEASNVEIKDLIGLYGDTKVKYGEVSPGRLGLGFAGEVNEPKHGQQYH